MTSPRIAVLGCGANGASIAADLVRAGHDVTLIEQWPEHVEAMRRDGITVRMPQETQVTGVAVLNICEVATLRHPFDIVFLLMKAYDTRWAAELIKPYLAEDGLLLGVQNGMSLADIQDIVGERRTMGCVIEITSAMFEPGIVERHSPWDRSWFAIGSTSDETRHREEEVAGLLRAAGTVEVVDDIVATKWMKIVSNATTLVTTAILGLPMIEADAIPEMREFMLGSGREALAAGQAEGYATLPIFGLKPADLDGDVVETLLTTLLGGFVLPTSTTTILQDWGKGRRSEVGDINGNVLRLSREHGLAAPHNERVCELARRIELGELRPDPTNLELLLQT
ncbi:ketopantoate reductase family protein [Tessaracoccus sp. MC1756]|uniref:ketopantoate reductase family protein n=1 Tax=Tessaracoccus sp. MC1756 TaxID=2760311 RepID=UPI001604984A|nr:2-dehydropantoate 2-reductase [Tessaracoccus sp. MC1756]MBB1510929.1 2-dehydropantoate 2-reductase [Tessaracoccus sp. MC1756]